MYATAPTFDLSKLLIQDMIKIEKNSHSFGSPEIENMIQKSKIVGFKEKIRRGNASFELRSSGHVVGGGTVIVESNNKRLFYTCLLYTSPSPRDRQKSRMPSSA